MANTEMLTFPVEVARLWQQRRLTLWSAKLDAEKCKTFRWCFFTSADIGGILSSASLLFPVVIPIFMGHHDPPDIPSFEWGSPSWLSAKAGMLIPPWPKLRPYSTMLKLFVARQDFLDLAHHGDEIITKHKGRSNPFPLILTPPPQIIHTSGSFYY
jgi:hypothetical protein